MQSFFFLFLEITAVALQDEYRGEVWSSICGFEVSAMGQKQLSRSENSITAQQSKTFAAQQFKKSRSPIFEKLSQPNSRKNICSALEIENFCSPIVENLLQPNSKNFRGLAEKKEFAVQQPKTFF